MGTSKVEQYLKRRMWRGDGIYHFCSLCGDYKLETEFYKNKSNPFGLSYKCKIHFKKETNKDPEVHYLKLSQITDNDFAGAQELLESMGYEFGPNQEPVWRQFEIKHNLK